MIPEKQDKRRLAANLRARRFRGGNRPKARAIRTGVDHIERKPLSDWLSGKAFSIVHGNNLVYNTCWEDPRLDREALELGPDDAVLMITSAGCNALDYALDSPRRIHAVDMNPRQNALLELKIAGIRRLEYEDFFRLFGEGHHPRFERLLGRTLGRELSPWARQYWEKRSGFFTNPKRSFYFCGSSGSVARFCNYYLDKVGKIRHEIANLLECETIEEQKAVYDRSIRKVFWSGFMKKALGNGATLSMLGVPRQQRQQVELHFGGGISEFMEQCVETVMTRLPMKDNYFWRVYLTGSYTPACCPNYLREEGFHRLRGGLVDAISIHTNTVEGFLRMSNERVTRFVLLDHMDWLSTYRYSALVSEWQAIADRAADHARILFRSGGMKVSFVDPIAITLDGRPLAVGDLLTYDTALASRLHEKDRVHTYGSFHIADMVKG